MSNEFAVGLPRRIGNTPTPLYLSKAAFLVVPGSQDMVRRPLEIRGVTEQHIDEMAQIGHSRGAGFNEFRLGRVANEVMGVAADYEGYANIVEGWGTPRLRFMLEFTKESSGGNVRGLTGSSTRYIYIGYTNYVGVDLQGHFDPDMEMYLTQVIVLRDTLRTGARARMETVSTLVYHDQILARDRYDRDYIPAYRITPEDVYATTGGILDYETQRGETVIAAQSSISNSIKSSQRGNLVPSNYFKRLLSAADSASTTFNVGAGEDTSQSSMWDQMIVETKERALSKDPLVQLMSHNGEVKQTGMIRFEELEEYFNVHDDNVCTVSWPGNMRGVNQGSYESFLNEFSSHEVNSFASMDNRHTETMLAQQIAMELPALLMGCFLVDGRFSVTNNVRNFQQDGYGWRFDTTGDMTNAFRFIVNGLPSDFEEDCIHNFITKFEKMVMDPLSYYGERSLSIFVDSKTDGEIVLVIELDGNPSMEYKVPTYADNIFSPVLTQDRRRVTKISNDMYRMTQNVLMSREEMYPEERSDGNFFR